MTLTPKLLQISPEYFLDLLVAISEGDQRKQLRKKLRDEIRKSNKDKEYLETQPMGRQLLGCGRDVLFSVIDATISDLIGGGPVFSLAKNVLNVMRQ